MSRMTPEEKQNIVFLYQSHTLKEVSILTGYPEKSIYYVIQQRGVKKGRGKRNTDYKERMREDCLNGFTDIDFLAKKYNCSQSTVFRILNGIKRPRRQTELACSITNAILSMENTGQNQSQIAKRFNVTRQYVSKLKKKLDEGK